MTSSKTFASLSFCTTLLCACAGQRADTASTEPVDAGTTVGQTPVESAVDPIPDGFSPLTPQLGVEDVDAAIEFYVEALGAQEVYKMSGPDGKTMHAEIEIGNSIVMLDRAGHRGMPSPKMLGGSPVILMVYIADAGKTYGQTVAAGAQATMPLDDQFWGDRYGELQDRFGHKWAIGQHIEDLSDEQMKQRSDLVMKEMAAVSDRATQPKGKGKKAKTNAAPPQPAWKSVAATSAEDPIPADYHAVTMALSVPDANAAISFYEQAFGAVLKDRMEMPNGTVMHAEVRIDGVALLLADEMPVFGTRSAASLGGSPVNIHHDVQDADAVFAKAKGLGGEVAYAIEDAPWGDRYGAVVDPTGLP